MESYPLRNRRRINLSIATRTLHAVLMGFDGVWGANVADIPSRRPRSERLSRTTSWEDYFVPRPILPVSEVTPAQADRRPFAPTLVADRLNEAEALAQEEKR